MATCPVLGHQRGKCTDTFTPVKIRNHGNSELRTSFYNVNLNQLKHLCKSTLNTKNFLHVSTGITFEHMLQNVNMTRSVHLKIVAYGNWLKHSNVDFYSTSLKNLI